MIEACSVTLRAGERTLLEDVSFTIPAGSFVAVLGPNGVGKTTLLRAIAGARKPDAGRLHVAGREIARATPNERARTIAYMAADDLFAEYLTVRDVVAAGRYAHHAWWQWHARPGDESAIEHAMQAVDLAQLADRAFLSLSTGERQRVWLALGLAQESPLLLLDEPTSHLDVRVAHAMLALLRKLTRAGKTVVCALHDLNEAAEFADRLLLLGCGRLLAFAPPEHVLTPELLAQAYGVRMETVRTPSGALRVFASATQE